MEYIVLWVLALFGLWCIISKVVENLYAESYNGNVEVIVKVRNQENIIENLIKELDKVNTIKKIEVLDMGSCDSTVDIVHKIQNENFKVKLISSKM